MAKGNLGSPRQGAVYELTGEYRDFPNFGKTFLFNDYKIIQAYPTDINAIASYLVDNIRGVGLKISQN